MKYTLTIECEETEFNELQNKLKGDKWQMAMFDFYEQSLRKRYKYGEGIEAEIADKIAEEFRGFIRDADLSLE